MDVSFISLDYASFFISISHTNLHFYLTADWWLQFGGEVDTS
jgi:hypothetical protein